VAESEPEKSSIIDAILEMKARDPFMPFRIILTSGDRFAIEQADNLVELKSEFFYALPGGESFVFLRNNQIAAVEGPEKKRPVARRRR
jgi:hypothetical protein